MNTCTIDGCDKPHRARGLCSTHYNRKHQPNRHPKRAMPCAWCGTEVVKQPRSEAVHGVVCSTACRTHLQTLARVGGTRANGTALVKSRVEPRIRVLASEVAKSRKVSPRRATVWHAGKCAHCEEPFVTAARSRTCSRDCARASRHNMLLAKAHRYRARRRNAFVSNVDPQAIYERDGWRCHVCGGDIDRYARRTPLAPSLDHVIPLANGGTHEPANVWACHLGCNSLRGNVPYLQAPTGQRVAVLF